MKDIVKFFDGLPVIIKFIFALPGLDFLWGIYRIAKGLSKGDLTLIIAGVVWIAIGWAIFWILDILTIVLRGKPTIFA
ncbi:MAG: hypothetical protein ACQEQA_05600 [Bacillota bacterium]